MTKTLKCFLLGNHTYHHSDGERTESDQVVTNLTPDQQAKYDPKETKKNDLISCHGFCSSVLIRILPKDVQSSAAKPKVSQKILARISPMAHERDDCNASQ